MTPEQQIRRWEERTHCPCGRTLPSLLTPYPYVCQCGREYGAAINLQALLRRVDELEAMLGDLYRHFGMCTECRNPVARHSSHCRMAKTCDNGTPGCPCRGEKHVCEPPR